MELRCQNFTKLIIFNLINIIISECLRHFKNLEAETRSLVSGKTSSNTDSSVFAKMTGRENIATSYELQGPNTLHTQQFSQ